MSSDAVTPKDVGVISKKRLKVIAADSSEATPDEVVEMAAELLKAREREYGGHCCEDSYSAAFAKWMP